ncbi:diguanylate cyclase [Hoeflea marina]|uniref:diguanylate cyclase n=1 Tax=Hoeflea marina TaxID=274592 RepID=A0A317PWA3_9HYPH|nr:GGDEF domain-containing protein [Hoeflea marina]PWW04566.1 diguanylate cyclase [Hoeflea marina]
MRDIATVVLATMRKRGISALPRNYELIYESILNSDPTLSLALNGVTDPSDQAALDALCRAHLPHLYQATVSDAALDHLKTEAKTMLAVLDEQQAEISRYSLLLAESNKRILSKSTSSTRILADILGALQASTDDKVEHGRTAIDQAGESSLEMRRIRQELDEYKRIANTDALTRLPNRRAFDEQLAEIYNDARPLAATALIVMDIDHFKRFNDTYGHAVGDQVLGLVAAILKAALRKDAFAARIGGEEFAILVMAAKPQAIQDMADALRLMIARTPLKNPKTGASFGRITVSLGLCMSDQADDPFDFYSKADIALYGAKAGGRNRMVQYRPNLEAEFDANRLLYAG